MLVATSKTDESDLTSQENAMLRTDLSDSHSPMAQAIAWSPHQHGLLLGCDGEEGFQTEPWNHG